MTDHRKVGDFPTNARIKITYPEGNEKPIIDFQYPDNERQIKGLWKSSGIFLPAMILTLITLGLLVYFIYFNSPIEYPLDCEGHVLTSNVTHETVGVNLFCNNITKYYHFQFQRTDFGSSWVEDTDSARQINRMGIAALWIVVAYIGLLYLYGKLISLIVRKTKFGKEGFPEWNKRIHNKHWEAKFTECPDSLQIELPLFSNMYLDYEAEEEFSDYLESMEIKEHDFTYYPTTGFKLRRHNRNIRKGVPNVYLWKAVFKFRKKPTKGFLKINWT